MYCPLCKAEYRTGFDRCSDCLVGLVSTLEQAQATSVVLLWKGTSQSKFNDIVEALREANVPALARSSVSCEVRRESFWDRIPILSDSKRMHDRMTWEVSILDSDYAKAQGAIKRR